MPVCGRHCGLLKLWLHGLLALGLHRLPDWLLTLGLHRLLDRLLTLKLDGLLILRLDRLLALGRHYGLLKLRLHRLGLYGLLHQLCWLRHWLHRLLALRLHWLLALGLCLKGFLQHLCRLGLHQLPGLLYGLRWLLHHRLHHFGRLHGIGWGRGRLLKWHLLIVLLLLRHSRYRSS